MLKLFLIGLLLAGFDCHSSFCGTDKLFKNMTLQTVSPIVTKRLRSSTRPFKIHMDYTSLNIEKLVSEGYVSNMKILLNEMVDFFEKLLLSIEDETTIYFNIEQTSDCYHVPLEFSPEVRKGVSTDLIVLPVVSSELPESTVAAAGPCLLRLGNYRPILGIIHLGRDYDFSDKHALKYAKTFLAHEMMHIFGFVGGLFDKFPNKPKIITKKINGIQRMLVATPKVLEVAKKHFGCESIEGIELENQGGPGSVGSHWEARTMLGDFMVSTVYPEFVISEITLAFLEDMGWYKVNYYTGGLFKFGKNQGCDFLNKPCYEGYETRFPKDFCEPNENKCFAGHRDRGFCYIAIPSERLPEEYQYFDDKPGYGGFEPADYCPVILTNMAQNGRYYHFNCHEGILEGDSTDRDEKIGTNSICVDSSLHKTSLLSNIRGTCYQVSCNFEKLTFDIQVGSNTVTCGQNMLSQQTVEGYHGTIKCPDFSRVCTSETWCTDMFDCVDKKATNAWLIVDSQQTYQKVSFVVLFSLLLAMIF